MTIRVLSAVMSAVLLTSGCSLPDSFGGGVSYWEDDLEFERSKFTGPEGVDEGNSLYQPDVPIDDAPADPDPFLPTPV
jgi:hypothetical protein